MHIFSQTVSGPLQTIDEEYSVMELTRAVTPLAVAEDLTSEPADRELR